MKLQTHRTTATPEDSDDSREVKFLIDERTGAVEMVFVFEWQSNTWVRFDRQ